METIGMIASIIAALGTVANFWFSIRNSKGYILKQIERKEEKISKIDYQLAIRYGLNRGLHESTPLDLKRSKLQEEIEELRKIL